MKFYYIIINLFLMVMATALIYLHVKHKKPKAHKILTQTPQAATVYEKDDYPRLGAPFPIKHGLNLHEGDIFLPNRGYVAPPPKEVPPEELSSKDKENIELVGICKFNSFAAAIIHDKTRGVDRRPYYKIGDPINKFSIKAIEADKVILTSGGKDFPLALDKKDKRSQDRMKSTYVPPKPSKKSGPKKTAFQIKQEEVKNKRKNRFLRALKHKP